MATTHNTQTWNISLNQYELKTSLILNTKYSNGENSIFFSNLPLWMKTQFIGANGLIDNTKLSAFYDKRANEVISAIVSNRKMLEVVEFDDLPLYVKERLQNSVVKAMDWLVGNSVLTRVSQTSIQLDGLSIETTTFMYTTISELLGNEGYTELILSGIHEYDYTVDANGVVTLFYKNDKVYSRFKTGEITNQVEINTTNDDALMTRENILKMINDNVIHNVGFITTTTDLEVLIDEVKWNELLNNLVPVNERLVGISAEISYNGPVEEYKNISERYVYDGTTWLLATQNYFNRQALIFTNSRIEAIGEDVANIKADAADKAYVDDGDTMDDAKILALEGAII